MNKLSSLEPELQLILSKFTKANISGGVKHNT